MAINLNDQERHMVLHNFLGCKQLGLGDEAALELALDLDEPLISKRLALPRDIAGGTGSGGGNSGGGGSLIGPGGPYGGIKGG